MRRLLLILLAALLVLPAAALAAVRAAGDGTLVVRDANGTVTIKGKGTIFGHFDHASLTVVDYNRDDTKEPQVNGAAKTRALNETTTRYTGNDVRFLLAGGKYTVKLQGYGVDVSAVGRGSATLQGYGTADDGRYSLGGAKPVDLTLLPVTVTFGTVTAP